jgi:hypothetical protein
MGMDLLKQQAGEWLIAVAGIALCFLLLSLFSLVPMALKWLSGRAARSSEPQLLNAKDPPASGECEARHPLKSCLFYIPATLFGLLFVTSVAVFDQNPIPFFVLALIGGGAMALYERFGKK